MASLHTSDNRREAFAYDATYALHVRATTPHIEGSKVQYAISLGELSKRNFRVIHVGTGQRALRIEVSHAFA